MECGVIVDAITSSLGNCLCLFQKLLLGFRCDDLAAPNWIVERIVIAFELVWQ